MINTHICKQGSRYYSDFPCSSLKSIKLARQFYQVPVIPQQPPLNSPDIDVKSGEWSYEAMTIEWNIRQTIVYLAVKIYGCIVWNGRLTKENNAKVVKAEVFGTNIEVALTVDFNRKSLCTKVKYCIPVGCRVFSKECVRWH